MTKRKLTSKKLKDEAWAYKRARALRMLRDGEMTITDICRATGLHHATVAKLKQERAA